MQVLPDVDDELAAVELDGDRRVAAAQDVGDRGAGRAGAARHRLADAALEDARADAVGRELGPERDVRAVRGSCGSCSIGGPIAGRSSASSSSRVGDADRALRVADLERLVARGPATSPSSPRSARGPCRRGTCGRRARSRGSRRRSSGSRTARPCAQPRWCRYMSASRAPLPDSSASLPSGLKIRSRATKPGSSVRSSSEHAVGADAGVAVAQRRTRRRRSTGSLDDEVVVAQRLPLLEPSCRASSMAATSSARSPGRRRRARRRAACASTSAGGGRSCACGASSRRRRRRAARRSRAPCARSPTPRPRARGADLLDRAARRPSRRRARRCARRARSRSMTRPTSRVGWRVSLGPQPVVALRRLELAEVEQLERADDAAAVARVDRARPPTARARPARRAAPRGRGRRSSRLPALARTSGGGGGCRSSSASAARRYRPVPPTTIGVRAARRAGRRSRRARGRRTRRREKRASTGTNDDEPVLERARCSAGVADAGEHLEARGRPAARRPTPRPGRSPRARRRSASASATSVLPTPVGPKSARTSAPSRAGSHAARSRVRAGMSVRDRQRAGHRRRPARRGGRGRVQARAGLGGAPADLVRRVRRRRAPRRARARRSRACTRRSRPTSLVGCGAARRARRPARGRGRHGRSPVWAASLDGGDGRAVPRRRSRSSTTACAVTGVPDLDGAAGAILLPDPCIVPDRRGPARRSRRARPACRSSAASRAAQTPDGGAGRCSTATRSSTTAARSACGSTASSCCRASRRARRRSGPELTVTAAEGHVIEELAGQPGAGQAARGHPRPRRRTSASCSRAGCCSGIVVDGGKPEYVQGDFLVRGLVGADPDEGIDRRRRRRARRARSSGCTRATPTRPTATCARRSGCGARRSAAQPPAGALVFTCNGRGREHVRRRRPRRGGDRRRARRRPGRRVLRGRRDRARSAARASCTASPRRWRSSRGERCDRWTSRRARSCSPAPPAASGRRSRARSPRAARSSC